MNKIKTFVKKNAKVLNWFGVFVFGGFAAMNLFLLASFIILDTRENVWDYIWAVFRLLVFGWFAIEFLLKTEEY
jgi:hypothetical protein